MEAKLVTPLHFELDDERGTLLIVGQDHDGTLYAEGLFHTLTQEQEEIAIKAAKQFLSESEKAGAA